MGSEKSFAAIAAETSRNALRAQEKENEHREMEAQKEEELLQREQQARAAAMLSEAKEKVTAASAESLTSIKINIMKWERESCPKWAKFRAEALKKLLEDEGLKVELCFDRMEPHGSDPLFDHTVHDLDLVVSW